MASDPVDAITDDPHSVANSQLTFANFANRQSRTIFESNDHAIAITLVCALDLISNEGTAERTADRRGRVTTATADLVPEDSTGDATDHGAKTRGPLIAIAMPFDRLDQTVLDALPRNGRNGPGVVDTIRLRCASNQ